MGFFKLFGGKKDKSEASPVAQRPVMPTVSVGQDYVETYEQVFVQQMNELRGLTRKEAKEILWLINNEHNGFMDFTYFEPVFERYFKGRDWSWPEYEYWDRIFEGAGQYPYRWPRMEANSQVTMFDVFGTMKVGELKEFLQAYQVAVPEKTRRAGLLALIEAMPGLRATHVWKSKASEKLKYAEKMRGHSMCFAFLRHIVDKARSKFDEERRIQLGIHNETLMVSLPGEEPLVQIALKLDPKGRPPFYPTDSSLMRAVIPGIED